MAEIRTEETAEETQGPPKARSRVEEARSFRRDVGHERTDPRLERRQRVWQNHVRMAAGRFLPSAARATQTSRAMRSKASS